MVIDHVIVMAASPSRLMETLTRTRPKAMLPVLGKPIIARVMDGYYNVGIRRFTVVVGEREGNVAEWLHSKWHPDVDLQFAMQGHRRGTASTLFATRHLIDSPFVIAPCDTLIPQEHILHLCNFFEDHPGDSTVLSLYRSPENVIGATSVLLDPRGQVMYISETPAGGHQGNITALPIFGLTPQILDYLDQIPVSGKSGGRMLSTAIQMMIDDKKVVGSVETDWAIHLHEPKNLLDANRHYLSNLKYPSLWSEVPTSVEVIPPVHIDRGVIVGENATIGPNTYLETGTAIGAGTVIEESVVLARRIGDDQIINGEIINKDIL